MSTDKGITAAELVKKVPPAVRPIVQAARRTVRGVAPRAAEIVSMSQPPRAKTYMWKLLRYAVEGTTVMGIGTFTKHAALFFDRGRELDDGTGLLEGSGKESRFITLRSAADAERPAVKRIVRKAFEVGSRRRPS